MAYSLLTLKHRIFIIAVIAVLSNFVKAQWCEDTVEKKTCVGWKTFSFCKELLNEEKHFNFMKVNCSRTCGFCSNNNTLGITNHECVDVAGEYTCTLWATQSVCKPGHMRYETMKSKCPKTCALCTAQRLWTSWSSWSYCSVSCGKEGHSARQRMCKSTEDGSIHTDCVGMTIDKKKCNHKCLDIGVLDLKPRPPQNIRLESFHNRLLLVWDEPKNLNYVISTYKVEYSSTAVHQDYVVNTLIINGNQTHTGGLSLCPGNIYHFNVSAAKEIAYGDAAMAKIRIVEDDWPTINFDNCFSFLTKQLSSLYKVDLCKTQHLLNCSSTQEVARNLSHITSQLKDESYRDISLVSKILLNVAENGDFTVNSTRNVTEDAFKVLDNILQSSQAEQFAIAQHLRNSSMEILRSITSFAKHIDIYLNKTNGTKFNMDKENIALLVEYEKSKHKTKTVIALRDSSKNRVQLMTSLPSNSTPDNVLALITLPNEVFKTVESSLTVTSLFYKHDFFFATENSSLKGSYVLSTSIGHDVANLKTPVIIKILKSPETFLTTEPCVFWKFTNSSAGGEWSSKGCLLVDNDVKYVTCHCNHLTNFAVLLRTTQQPLHEGLALSIVTWVGCGLSLLGLLLTIFSYLVSRDKHNKLPHRILINLCVSLVLLLITFLSGIESTSSSMTCKVVAVLLHYFTLTTFCWMFVQGINIYKFLVAIFRTSSEKKFMMIASIFSWGSPSLLVVTTAVVNPTHYGNKDFCVVYGYSFYIVLLLPVVLILGTNTVILVVSMYNLARRSARQNTSINKGESDVKSKLDELLISTKLSLSFSIVMGVTWLFGIFCIGQASIIFEWLFCIFNSLQGFFIFLLYAWRKELVQKSFFRVLKSFHNNADASHGHNLSLLEKTKCQL